MKSASLSQKQVPPPKPPVPSTSSSECRGVAVTIAEENLTVITTITPTHRQLVKTMAITSLFWKDLFSLHNLFTCDRDGRECHCKDFFNSDIWQSDYEHLAAEIEQWDRDIGDFLDRRNFLFAESERFDEIFNIYKERCSRVVEWQAHHAYNEHMFLYGQLCHACSEEAGNYRVASWDLLSPSSTSNPSSPSAVPYR